jgi:hypothetical protein
MLNLLAMFWVSYLTFLLERMFSVCRQHEQSICTGICFTIQPVKSSLLSLGAKICLILFIRIEVSRRACSFADHDNMPSLEGVTEGSRERQ